jgi:hypothetical protein
MRDSTEEVDAVSESFEVMHNVCKIKKGV